MLLSSMQNSSVLWAAIFKKLDCGVAYFPGSLHVLVLKSWAGPGNKAKGGEASKALKNLDGG